MDFGGYPPQNEYDNKVITSILSVISNNGVIFLFAKIIPSEVQILEIIGILDQYFWTNQQIFMIIFTPLSSNLRQKANHK